jgi:GNAT superfamily N-acetyltransferase
MVKLKVSSESDAPREDLDVIGEGLNQYNIAMTGHRDYRRVGVFLRDEIGKVVGGLSGAMWGGWMHIGHVWIVEALRGQGYGSQLLRAAEDEARRHGCRGIFLDTFSFQARPFYERFGYKVVGEIADFPPGHSLYFMKKVL